MYIQKVKYGINEVKIIIVNYNVQLKIFFRKLFAMNKNHMVGICRMPS